MEELIRQVMGQLGVNEDQAKGGVGLLFKLARDKLAAGDFAALTGKLGNVEDLIKAAPPSGAAAKLLGGLASSLGAGELGALTTLAGGFKKLGLDEKKVTALVTAVLGFVQKAGGDGARAVLQKALKS